MTKRCEFQCFIRLLTFSTTFHHSKPSWVEWSKSRILSAIQIGMSQCVFHQKPSTWFWATNSLMKTTKKLWKQWHAETSATRWRSPIWKTWREDESVECLQSKCTVFFATNASNPNYHTFYYSNNLIFVFAYQKRHPHSCRYPQKNTQPQIENNRPVNKFNQSVNRNGNFSVLSTPLNYSYFVVETWNLDAMFQHMQTLFFRLLIKTNPHCKSIFVKIKNSYLKNR